MDMFFGMRPENRELLARVAAIVRDEAVQMFGGQGVGQDRPRASAWTHVRKLRLADGPDAVHRRRIARSERKKSTQERV